MKPVRLNPVSSPRSFLCTFRLISTNCSFFTDVDDEYEDEDQWEDGAEDILEKGTLWGIVSSGVRGCARCALVYAGCGI